MNEGLTIYTKKKRKLYDISPEDAYCDALLTLRERCNDESLDFRLVFTGILRKANSAKTATLARISEGVLDEILKAPAIDRDEKTSHEFVSSRECRKWPLSKRVDSRNPESQFAIQYNRVMDEIVDAVAENVYEGESQVEGLSQHEASRLRVLLIKNYGASTYSRARKSAGGFKISWKFDPDRIIK